jgi:uncharacterized protein YjbI with pentapeptide repeats
VGEVRHANLIEANLSGANLSRGLLRGADVGVVDEDNAFHRICF